MNLSLSYKIKLMDQRKFFDERTIQPCWYISVEKNEKKQNFKCKIGVKLGTELEEHTFITQSNDNIFQLLSIFQRGGFKDVKEFLKLS